MFAELSPKEQTDRVLTALQDVLGDTPTRSDYMQLLMATHEASAILSNTALTLPSNAVQRVSEPTQHTRKQALVRLVKDWLLCPSTIKTVNQKS